MTSPSSDGVYLRTRSGKQRYIVVKNGVATVLRHAVTVAVEDLDKGERCVKVRENP